MASSFRKFSAPAQAFSLVELMVAVSVLSVGIVLIARSFLSAATALNFGENKIIAVSFLDNKMSEVEEKSFNGDDDITPSREDLLINGKRAVFEAGLEVITTGEEDKEILNKVTLFLNWKEGSRSYDETIVTYIEGEKKEEVRPE